MAEADLGAKLIETGWDQGMLLPPLEWTVLFDKDNPASKLAEKSLDGASRAASSGVPHAIASGIAPKADYLVVASQACDIRKDVNYEPNVVALRVFKTDNDRILRDASATSARHFLLNQETRLVADAAYQALIEKPLLLTIKPTAGITDAATRKRFKRWLGRRYTRAALPDSIVFAVQKPLVDNIRVLRQRGDVNIGFLDSVSNVLLGPTGDTPPFDVKLMFLIGETVAASQDDKIRSQLAPIAGAMQGWFDPALATLQEVGALRLAEISAAAMLDSEEISLDHYTYQGQVIIGSEPHKNIA